MAELVPIINGGHQEICALIADLFARAQRGELLSFAYVVEERGGNVGQGWERGPGSSQHMLVAGTLYLQQRLLECAVEKD